MADKTPCKFCCNVGFHSPMCSSKKGAPIIDALCRLGITYQELNRRYDALTESDIFYMKQKINDFPEDQDMPDELILDMLLVEFTKFNLRHLLKVSNGRTNQHERRYIH